MMEDGMEDVLDEVNGSDEPEKGRSQTATSVDLNTDSSLEIDISDALSEKDRVKFTVHTKTTLSQFQKPEFSVARLHEEFVWLHDRFVETEGYAGVIIPPAPPKPDFDASREKLQKLSDGEGSITKEEFDKMKAELEAEYLATFKKTVAMHEVFLQRIAVHSKLRDDVNFKVFLEYEEDLCARSKNKKEKIGGFISALTKKADETLILSGQKEPDEYFEKEKAFLTEYHGKLATATQKADKTTRSRKDVADCYIKLSTGLVTLSTIENTELDKLLCKVAECFEKTRKLEGRMASDLDLKLSDLLRYYTNDTRAALDLLYRRSRSLANFEHSNKALDKARQKNKDVASAEATQQSNSDKFEKITEVAKEELSTFKERRVVHFRKNLTEMAELQIKHAKAKAQIYRMCLNSIKEDLD
ncbi:sorting nexin-6-like isoform X1 [Watersipora subatra]|uniref:sorting nexin-6-like isoform X1 n=1 Tax=Watersipora subatra TaxID=2589382 RepID=UPI00355C9493